MALLIDVDRLVVAKHQAVGDNLSEGQAELRERASLVSLHQTRIANYIGSDDHC